MARKAGFDRNEIVTRARDLFWRKGFQGTSLKDLEEVLGLKPGSIYAAFGSKEALFLEALDLYAQSGRDSLLPGIESGSPLTFLAGYVRAMGRTGEGNPPARACMLVKTVLEHPDTTSPARLRAEQLMADMEALFTRAFVRAREQGEIAAGADPARLGRKFQSDVTGLRIFAQRSDAAGEIAELAEDLALSVEALRV
ncbi:MAG: TetR/AcrR family transcriptional regulator [Silicimonas sp.]|nr:TetR/AcrR family transcriptional regulator [Silicimonas sp.]